MNAVEDELLNSPFKTGLANIAGNGSHVQMGVIQEALSADDLS